MQHEAYCFKCVFKKYKLNKLYKICDVNNCGNTSLQSVKRVSTTDCKYLNHVVLAVAVNLQAVCL